jgi:hypothetical protein
MIVELDGKTRTMRKMLTDDLVLGERMSSVSVIVLPRSGVQEGLVFRLGHRVWREVVHVDEMRKEPRTRWRESRNQVHHPAHLPLFSLLRSCCDPAKRKYTLTNESVRKDLMHMAPTVGAKRYEAIIGPRRPSFQDLRKHLQSRVLHDAKLSWR